MPGGRHLREPLRRAAGQRHGRLARKRRLTTPMSFQNTPCADAGAERLGAGLLGGETLGVGSRPRRAAVGFGALDLGEAAAGEALAVALERLLDAADVAEIACRSRGSCAAAAPRPSSIAGA